MSADWFKPSDLNSPEAVRLLLPGGEASGFLGRDVKGQRQWRVLRDSGAVDVLPFEPFAWRPLPEDLGGHPWPHPLPEPITLSRSGRFVDVRPRKLAAMAAQAEQSRETMAEIEAEHGAPYVPLPHSTEDQWWLDQNEVTYSERGSISLDEAEARVSRAILTDGIKHFERRTLRDVDISAGDSALANIVAASISADGIELIKNFRPTPRDLSDYDTAFGWFAAIAPVELRPAWARNDWYSGQQKVLVWRAIIPQKSWRRIAQLAGGTQEGWRKTWGGALEIVRRVANGQPPLLHVKVADQVAALKERNRAWKRRRTELERVA